MNSKPPLNNPYAWRVDLNQSCLGWLDAIHAHNFWSYYSLIAIAKNNPLGDQPILNPNYRYE